MILFLKTLDGSHQELTCHEKLILIYKDRVKTVDNEKDRERAAQQLARLQSSSDDSEKEGAKD